MTRVITIGVLSPVTGGVYYGTILAGHVSGVKNMPIPLEVMGIWQTVTENI